MASSLIRTEPKKNYKTMEEDGEGSWKLSNIGGIGTAEDIQLRAEAAGFEDDFVGAGSKPGVEVWRVEKFEIERIGALRAGNLSMYSGDAYLVLKSTEDGEGNMNYALHYWIGDEATQDESGAIAYYAVTLDDLLGQKPVQYRETQDEESALFHSYFKSVVYLKGGVDTGFKKVEPETYTPRLMRMSGSGKSVRVKQIDMDPSLVNSSDVFLLDLGLKVYQFNAPHASMFERIRGSEIVNEDLKAERDELELIIIDGEEELLQCEDFWAALGGPSPESLPQTEDSRAVAPEADEVDMTQSKKLFRISDDSGTLKMSMTKEADELSASDVNDSDCWGVSVDGRAYFYIGDGASYTEKISVRCHMPSVLETMGLPRFAPTTVLSPGENPVWDAIFSS